MKALAGTSRTQIPRVSSAMVEMYWCSGFVDKMCGRVERLEGLRERDEFAVVDTDSYVSLLPVTWDCENGTPTYWEAIPISSCGRTPLGREPALRVKQQYLLTPPEYSSC